MFEQINDTEEYDGGAVLVATTMTYCKWKITTE